MTATGCGGPASASGGLRDAATLAVLASPLDPDVGGNRRRWCLAGASGERRPTISRGAIADARRDQRQHANGSRGDMQSASSTRIHILRAEDGDWNADPVDAGL
jgi:hypothetical protein